MVYRNFYLNIIIRVALIFLNSLWLAYEIANPPFVYTILFLGSLLLIQTYALIWYVNKTNRELSKFFISLRDKDSSFSIVGKEKGRSFRELAQTLNETAALIREARIEKEKQFRYLQFVIGHVGIGLIAFSGDGRVSLVNNSLLKLLDIKSLHQLNQLNRVCDGFEDLLLALKPGEQSVFKLTIKNEIMQLLIRMTGFKYQDEHLKLASLQDFRQELEEQEIRSWQKLIRVMTHEIMNSVTPITTLTLAIKRCLGNEEKIKTLEELEEEDIRDVVINSDLIEERSKGLIGFVNNYRSISKIDKLTLSDCKAEKLLTSTVNLFKEECRESNIEIGKNVQPQDLTLSLDEKLLQQVLINLVKNAMEAVKGVSNAAIHLSATSDSKGIAEIKVTDNGQGIPKEKLDEIFIPFFTTKKDGNGIGLTLSRQVMRLHKGSIKVTSIPGKKTIFSLTF